MQGFNKGKAVDEAFSQDIPAPQLLRRADRNINHVAGRRPAQAKKAIVMGSVMANGDGATKTGGGNGGQWCCEQSSLEDHLITWESKWHE